MVKTKGLEGKTVVLTASRKTDEMTAIIEKQGGKAVVRSLQGTVFLAAESLEEEVNHFITAKVDWVIFTTGIGTTAIVEAAEKLGKKQELLDALNKVKIAARGYKTIAVLKKLDLKADVVDEDGTTNGLMEGLKKQSFNGADVIVQLHGLSSPMLISFLEEKGANVKQILPYQHIAPKQETVEQLINEIIKKEVDAVCFTTFIQARSLFDQATKLHKADELKKAFEKDVIAVAVGKVTAEALKEAGVKRIITPELERMGAMMVELAKYVKQQV